MILTPHSDGVASLLPASFGESSMSAAGLYLPGERAIFPDDNSNHTPTLAVFAHHMPTPRTHGWVVFQTGHLNIWTSSDLGAGSGSDASNCDDQHPMPGTWFTGTTTTGHISIGPGANVNLFSSASHLLIVDAIFMVPTLSTSGERFNVRFGWADVIAGAVANGAYFEFDSAAAAAGNMVTANASTRTTTTTGIAIVAGVWYRVRVVVTNATQADCYLVVEGTALPSTPTVSIASNIPSGAALSPTAFIEKSAGTTTRSLSVLHFLAGQDRLAA